VSFDGENSLWNSRRKQSTIINNERKRERNESRDQNKDCNNQLLFTDPSFHFSSTNKELIEISGIYSSDLTTKSTLQNANLIMVAVNRVETLFLSFFSLLLCSD
jgi:hypothetical protein